LAMRTKPSAKRHKRHKTMKEFTLCFLCLFVANVFSYPRSSAADYQILPPCIIDQNNVAAQAANRVSQPLPVAAPFEGRERIGLPVRQLFRRAAIDRLNPNVA